jgi:hypothetical protein
MKMTVMDSYAGTEYKDLVFSQLRFYDGKRYFLIDPVDFVKGNIKSNRESFTAAGVDNILDQSISIIDENSPHPSDLSFRFRSDGSLYAEGNITYNSAESTKANNYFVVGNYEVLKSGPGKGIDLRIFGYIITKQGELGYPYAIVGGGGGGDCGGDSGPEGYIYKNSTKKIFAEFLTITRSDTNTVSIKNTGKYNFLNFNQSDFRVDQD